MKIRLTVLSLLSAVLCAPTASHALTEKGREALEQLQAQIAQENQEATPDPRTKAARQSLLQALQGYLDQPEKLFQQDLARIESRLTSEESKQWLAVLQTEVKAEQTEQARLWTEEFERAKTSAAEAMRKSQAARDFDESIQAMKSLARPQNPELDPALPRQLSAIQTFLMQWQEHLAAKEDDDMGDARNALRRAIASNPPVSFMPRSEWLRIVLAAKRETDAERKSHDSPTGIEQQVDGILSAVEKLDDLNTALKALRELQTGSGDTSKFHSFSGSSGSSSRTPLKLLIDRLQFLDKNYQELKAGLPVNLALQAPSTSGTSHRSIDTDIFAAHVARLKAAYLTRALPRFLELPEDMKPEADESFAAYVRRAALAHGETAGPPFLLRCQEALLTIERGDSRQNHAEDAGIRAYATAGNQEAAGRHEEAVYAYLDALRSNSELLPLETIGKRLQGLKEAQPEAYARGAARFQQMPVRGGEAARERSPEPRHRDERDKEDKEDKDDE